MIKLIQSANQINMSTIIAGTAFGQVFSLSLNVAKPKQRITKHGMMKKQRIAAISLNNVHPQQCFYYASQKNVYAGCYNDESEQTVWSNKYGNANIVGLYRHQQSLVCALNNGSIVSISKQTEENSQYQDQEVLVGKFEPDMNKRYNKLIYDGSSSFCMVGKEVLPFLYDSNKSLVTWTGKNVPNDELDLKVPVNDVDATFFKNGSSLACAHALNKVRVYDVRTNKQKPSSDFHLKLDKVYNKSYLTKIEVNPHDESKFYIANDLGAIYECDIRKSMLTVGKFKSINSTVTDMKVHENQLFTSSLDCYVRSFDLQSKQVLQKFYMNKPIYSLAIKVGVSVEVNQFAEEVLSQAEQEQLNPPEPQSKKMRKLRKRNKVNLKYLKPINWDDVPIEEELLQEAKQQYEQINAKDAESYEYDQDQIQVKNQEQQHGDQHDSDLD